MEINNGLENSSVWCIVSTLGSMTFELIVVDVVEALSNTME